MPKLTWDNDGERLYETGVRNGVLYPLTNGSYTPGVAWNGLTGVSESPSGAEATALWADDIKYLNLYSREEYACSITAYTYPDEFAECDGSASLATGVTIGQQSRKTFGFCYRTAIGNDVDGDTHGYKLHMVYGCKAAPSSRDHSTINDSPEAMELSWDISTTPVPVTITTNSISHQGYTATLEIDSTKVDSTKLAALEAVLYGTDGENGTTARLPLPDEILAIIA